MLFSSFVTIESATQGCSLLYWCPRSLHRVPAVPAPIVRDHTTEDTLMTEVHKMVRVSGASRASHWSSSCRTIVGALQTSPTAELLLRS